MRRIGWAWLVTAACAPESGTLHTNDSGDTSSQVEHTGDSASLDTGSSCDTDILAFAPLDGSERVDAGEPFSIRFRAGLDPIAGGYTVRLWQTDLEVAQEVPVSLIPGNDAQTFVISPIGAVRAGAYYELRAEGPCGTAVSRFSTSAPSWRLELSASELTSPADVEDLLGLFGPELLSLEGVSATSLSFLVAPIRAGVQDRCVPTAKATGSRADGVSKRFTAAGAAISIDSKSYPVLGLTFDAIFDASISRLQTVDKIEMRVPVTPIAAAWDEAASDVCGDELSCVPCELTPDGCVRVTLSAVGTGTASLPLEPRTADDIARDASCH